MHLPNLKDAKVRTKNNINTDYFSFDEKYKNISVGKKYFIRTYGCQMNEHDSENVKALVEYMGYVETDIMDDSNLIILNTCSIRENAHNKAFGMLGRIKRLRQSNKDLIVGIMGCMAQEEVVVNEIIEKYKWIDFVIGTHNINEINKVIYDAILKKELNVEVYSMEGDIIEGLPSLRNNKYKAFVNIMYGCDKFCTYCIVPYTRGKQRSRAKDDIINEIKELIKKGYKEVTLLGQNVNAYGKDLDIEYDMSNLLQDVSDTGIDRVRFMTSHPWDFTDNMINVIKNNSNIMPHIHLPVQSGSNAVLKMMGRRYTKESYLNLVKKLRDNIPNLSLTTDIIVGFPTETEDSFKETIDLVEEVNYDLAYTFIFSKRVGTPAYNMKELSTQEENKERLKQLNAIINKQANENNKKYIGKISSVLIEGLSEKDPNKLMGYTEENKLVNVEGSKENIGKIVLVEITKAKTWSLDGKIIN
ncbi:MAG TPA: tRNA (N6-isopentenyl adenosine(37)-C2)-methylthiotransferase MiaB [Bacilli bacterium]|nr:tRNA (N6-isopentenyl adenosine(37)-C2)-methylthiotransferase MiaB [Bacilli bacterium]